MHEARLPRIKTLAEFDLDANPNIDAATIARLAEGAFITNNEPVVLLGNSGTGKRHLLIDINPTLMVGVVDRLETQGLVERQRNPDDRRRHAVVVTTAGRALIGRGSTILQRTQNTLLHGLDPAERQHLADLTARALHAHWPP